MSRARAQYLQLLENGPQGLLQRLVFLCLCLLSALYGLAVALRTRLYKCGWLSAYRAAVPVVSVGNLTVGGTGKTPIVDLLVKKLVGAGVKVAVVSRGYKGSYTGNFYRVQPGAEGAAATAEFVGDEPFLLALRNPDAAVYVARKRRFGVEAAEADGAECIILDDAFQHLRVARDLDIVLLDAKRPFGNGFLLPAGPLREQHSALQRADLFILSRAEPGQEMPFATDKPLSLCTHRIADEVTSLGGNIVPLAQLQDQRGVAFAGIASPENFFLTLQKAGLVLDSNIAFADHGNYGHDQIRQLEKAAVNVDYLITTEKDAVKLTKANFSKTCYVTQLEVDFIEDTVFAERIRALVHEIKSAQVTG